MSKLTGAALDHKVAHATGLKSVNNCEQWGKSMTEEDEEFQRLEREAKMRALEDDDIQDYVRPWVGLTDKEIWSIVGRIGTADSDVNPYQILNDARAIEQRLKEKNA